MNNGGESGKVETTSSDVCGEEKGVGVGGELIDVMNALTLLHA